MATYNGMRAGELRQARWQKSSFSANANNNCVEMARLPGGKVAVRNSRDPEGPALIYTLGEVEAFIRGARNGDFDDLIR
ncbi:MAG TPA: DUF397 domain-containing protein [Actinomycetota bacterium]|jgi:hypothetical protein